MKFTTLAASLLTVSIATMAYSQNAVAETTQRHVYTYVLELDEDGSIRTLEPSGSIPADTRSELDRHIQGWVFQPAEVDGRRVATGTFLRVGVEIPAAGRPLRILSATTGPAPQAIRFPDYPASAQRRGEEGVVVLKLQVDADGRVQQAMTYDDSPRAARALVDAAQKAAATWRFQPERIDGQPVASTVLLPVCFMTAEPTPQTCAWEGPEARRFTRQTVLTLDPAARLVSGLAYEGN